MYLQRCSTPSARGQFAHFKPAGCLEDLDGSYHSDDESFRFFRQRDRLEFDSSSSDEETEQIRHLPRTGCSSPLTNLVYIDDFNSIEKLRVVEAESHITTNKRKIRARAPKSEQLFRKSRVFTFPKIVLEYELYTQ